MGDMRSEGRRAPTWADDHSRIIDHDRLQMWGAGPASRVPESPKKNKNKKNKWGSEVGSGKWEGTAGTRRGKAYATQAQASGAGQQWARNEIRARGTGNGERGTETSNGRTKGKGREEIA